jgi:hypothetical protein
VGKVKTAEKQQTLRNQLFIKTELEIINLNLSTYLVENTRLFKNTTIIAGEWIYFLTNSD